MRKEKNICVRCWSETSDQKYWVKDDEDNTFCSDWCKGMYKQEKLQEINEVGE
jgi:hypothetical protein